MAVRWIQKLIIEHGSAASLRDHVSLLKTQNEISESAKIKAETQCEVLKSQLAESEAKNEILKSDLADANSEIKNLESVRKALRDQTQLLNQISQLEAMNQELERQLRVGSIGF